jgi:transcriptional regulator with XRE-family HTH domain
MALTGMTQGDLVTHTGAHSNRVRDWLRGARWPSVPHLAAIAKTLGTDLGWLLTGETPSEKASKVAKSLDERGRQAVDVARELADLRPRLVDLAERAHEVAGSGT